MENQSDEILWSLYLKGDKEALEQIYRRYYPLLLNYGCRLSANQDLVQDCIQNLFIKLMSKSRNLSATPSVKGYLLKPSATICWTVLKKKKNTMISSSLTKYRKYITLQQKKNLPLKKI